MLAVADSLELEGDLEVAPQAPTSQAVLGCRKKVTVLPTHGIYPMGNFILQMLLNGAHCMAVLMGMRDASGLSNTLDSVFFCPENEQYVGQKHMQGPIYFHTMT